MFDFKYYVKRCFFLFGCVLLQTVLAVFYWGKKKTVPPVRNPLLLKSATTLAKGIRERKFKSEEVVQAYINRILEVNPLINAVVQDNFKGALKEAKEIDDFIASGEFLIKELSERKPLLGVPFTVKCGFSVKGFQQTAGSLVFKDRIGIEDAPSVALLKKSGGIFLALTNTPEFSCTIESANYLYGRTCNPYDTTKACGGSTGGEGALIAAAGSVIGLGAEIYGSIRIPGSYCGIFGYKPTRGLTSHDGFIPTSSTVDDYLSAGPLCRYSEDIPTLLNVLSNNVKNMDLDEQIDFKKIKIYYQTDLNYVWSVKTDKEIAQAVRKAAFYFNQEYGSEIQEVNVPFFNKSNAIACHLYRKDLPDSKFTERITDGRIKKINGILESFKLLCRKSQFSLTALLILKLSSTSVFYSEKNIDAHEKILKDLVEEFQNLLHEDAVFLCPTTPTTAIYHNQMYSHYYSAFWTGAFNLIGFPVTQCPMGLSHKDMPIGIQIVACKGNDALTIACAKELEKAFGGWIPPLHNPG